MQKFKSSDTNMSDIKLNYIDKGSGFPFVFLHGNGEASDYFAEQLLFFSQSYRVIAVDTRGHGRSPRGTAPFTLRQFADDLFELLEELGISKLHLLGFSDGANIALLYALKHPESIERLILNGADLYPSGVKPCVQIPIYIGYAAATLISLLDKKATAKKEMLGLMVTQPDIKPAQLETLKMPSLVIVGTNDMIKDSHSRLIASSLGNSRLVRIKGDHFIAAKRSDEFNRKVALFLEEN